MAGIWRSQSTCQMLVELSVLAPRCLSVNALEHSACSTSSSSLQCHTGSQLQGSQICFSSAWFPDVQVRGFKQSSAEKRGTASAGSAGKRKKGSGKDSELESPRMRKIMQMLLPPKGRTVHMSQKEQQALEAQRKAVKDALTVERHAWMKELSIKHKLQQAALKALPDRLRKLAMEPDMTPFPLNRNFLFLTPPEAYRD